MLDLSVRMSSQWTTLPAASGAGGSRLTSNLISKSLGRFRERSWERGSASPDQIQLFLASRSYDSLILGQKGAEFTKQNHTGLRQQPIWSISMETLGGLGLRTNLPCTESAIAVSCLQTTTLVPGCSLTGVSLYPVMQKNEHPDRASSEGLLDFGAPTEMA